MTKGKIMNDEEMYLLQTIYDLKKSYEQAAKPYVDRLVAIRSMQQPKGIILTPDQAAAYSDVMMRME